LKTHIDYTEQDLLDCQLFVASKSKIVKRTRRVTFIRVTGLCFFCAIVFYIGGDKVLMCYCIAVGIIALLFYPAYQRRFYKKHYHKFVTNKYKNLTDLDYKIQITQDTIFTTSKLGDGNIKTSQIEDITETSTYFFLKLSTGDTLTLPKRSFDAQNLNEQLVNIAAANNLSIKNELDWQWK
jgi:hypothetical protein